MRLNRAPLVSAFAIAAMSVCAGVVHADPGPADANVSYQVVQSADGRSIETTLGVFAEAQTRIDATITAHMDAEERARADDIAWRKRRQSEHDTRLAAIEARLSLLEATS